MGSKKDLKMSCVIGWKDIHPHNLIEDSVCSQLEAERLLEIFDVIADFSHIHVASNLDLRLFNLLRRRKKAGVDLHRAWIISLPYKRHPEEAHGPTIFVHVLPLVAVLDGLPKIADRIRALTKIRIISAEIVVA